MSTQQQVLFTKPTNISIAVGSSTTPFITVYPWSSGTGFGTKYSNPASPPTNFVVNAAFSNRVDAIVCGLSAQSLSNSLAAYPWNLVTGFGTRYSDPATKPSGRVYDVSFSRDDTSIALTSLSTSPYIYAYPWNSSTGFGTKYANPATLPTNAQGVAFSPVQDVIFVAANASPYIYAYPWNSSTGFGTKYADPATLPGSLCSSVAVSPNGSYVILSSQFSPYVHAYPWNISTGFGTKYANPATLVTARSEGIAFHPNGDALAFLVTGVGPAAYKWSGSGFGTKYADPVSGLIAAASGSAHVSFSPDGRAIAQTGPSGSSVHAYAWDSVNGFGTKYADPATFPSGTGNSVTFSNYY